MPTVEIELCDRARNYPVKIDPGLLERLGSLVRDRVPADRCVLLVDAAVLPLHAARATASLEAAGYATRVEPIPPGEASKTLATIERLYGVMLEHRMERQSPVIALGGGVTGDSAGFLAASFLRGVPFVQCPTTLLSMVDASVGGKVGVNLPQGKNLVGAFHQPALVVIDPSVLRTLPEREIGAGLAECIKHAAIRDAGLLDFMDRHMKLLRALDLDLLGELIERNVQIKARVVMEDERESGVRAHLNFGHTFGHAIEATTGFGTWLHGEAVALGMLAASRAGEEMGLCNPQVRARLSASQDAAGLPCSAALPDDATLEAAMRRDKKVSEARIRFILPTSLGRVCIRDDVPPSAVRAAWETLRNPS